MHILNKPGLLAFTTAVVAPSSQPSDEKLFEKYCAHSIYRDADQHLIPILVVARICQVKWLKNEKIVEPVVTRMIQTNLHSAIVSARRDIRVGQKEKCKIAQ